MGLKAGQLYTPISFIKLISAGDGAVALLPAYSGTPEMKTTSAPFLAEQVCIQALSGNSAPVFIGGSAIQKTNEIGVNLDPKVSRSYLRVDLSKVFVCVTVAAGTLEGVAVDCIPAEV